ncbi:phosphatidylinositol 4-kinase [Crossiella sp. S99.2]|nr:phosphatidylinositol 4-kinase [Crossiella sp. S99.2]MCK2250512.1 phosphatidylinositol 4-kinase [Crossiella sp. S99.1]
MVTGPLGDGSLQDFVDALPGRAAGDYPLVQQERLAVLDYIAGNTDRHRGNYLTDRDGNLVAIDHRYSFPESPDPDYGIRSDFTAALFQLPLSPEVLTQVRAIEPDALRAVLHRMGLSEDSVEGAAGRLVEVQAHGMINGEAWPGRLQNAGLLTVRGSRP